MMAIQLLLNHFAVGCTDYMMPSKPDTRFYVKLQAIVKRVSPLPPFQHMSQLLCISSVMLYRSATELQRKQVVVKLVNASLILNVGASPDHVANLLIKVAALALESLATDDLSTHHALGLPETVGGTKQILGEVLVDGLAAGVRQEAVHLLEGLSHGPLVLDVLLQNSDLVGPVVKVVLKALSLSLTVRGQAHNTARFDAHHLGGRRVERGMMDLELV